ncbi:DUF4190 domain-containing protein [Candidatus Nomurabacteria bacterium]|nr:DUF4190 domain-containing protein [Candidatus Nomurabacteria bacterium]
MDKIRSKEEKNDVLSLVSFILGLLSIFLFEIGAIPVFAIVFGICGISRTTDEDKKGRWMAVTGLILGILYTIAQIYNLYG